MTKNQSLSIANKVALFFIFVLVFLGGGFFLVLKKVHEQDLLRSARQIANLATAVLEAPKELGGLWVPNKTKIQTVGSLEGLRDDGEALNLYRVHDPDFSRFLLSLARTQGAELRLDFQARGVEKWSFVRGDFLYQHPIVVTRACVTCHLRHKEAPSLREGETAGMFYVNFPEQSFYSLLGSNLFLGGAVVFLVVTLLLYTLVRYELIKPLLDLTRKVQEMSLGNLDVNFGVSNLNEKDAKDEIIQLTIAMERLRKSQKTMERMLDDDSLVL